MDLEEIIGPSHRFQSPKPRRFNLAGLSGQVVELSGWNNAAGTSLAVPLILECQEAFLPSAWIVPRSASGVSLFFPPDFARCGIECDRLPILWADSAADALGIAEKLLRTGGFGMLVLDLTEARVPRRGNIGRIHAQARKQESLVLCLTRKPPGSPSLDPMVFLHLHAESRPAGVGQYAVDALVLKDKNHAPGHRLRRLYESPPGLP